MARRSVGPRPALLLLTVLAAPAAAQQPPAPGTLPVAPPGQTQAGPPGAQGGQLPTVPPAGGDTLAAGGAVTRLLFEREVFTYPDYGRRDPFVQLSALSDVGPTIDELVLVSTMVVRQDPARSVAAFRDAAGRVRNVRRGEVLGNVTVLEIDNFHVVVAVDEFGVRRTETLRIRPRTTGGTD